MQTSSGTPSIAAAADTRLENIKSAVNMIARMPHAPHQRVRFGWPQP
jgi:hypothetical protein